MVVEVEAVGVALSRSLVMILPINGSCILYTRRSPAIRAVDRKVNVCIRQSYAKLPK
jgi:hypothetical protein